ncbi:MAG: hypothetical protein U9O56_03215 [Campylobacterota bacterium]|nr:hypothetical protein [Campylobacterota bacterium]
MFFKYLYLSSFLFFGSLFIGCNDLKESTESPILTGNFLDAPVKGLRYETKSLAGITDENGEFNYRENEIIEFKLGTLSLGSTTASSIMSPYTLGNSTIDDPSIVTKNIALLLQNFNSDRNNTQTLNITNLKAYNFDDINLSDQISNTEDIIYTLLSSSSFVQFVDESNTSLLDENTTTNNMKTYIEENLIKFDLLFTDDYLNNRVFYSLKYNDSNLTLYRVQFTTTNYITNLYNNTSYEDNITLTSTIEDGKIKITNEDNSTTYVGITSVDDDKIYTDNLGYLYFDELVAKIDKTTELFSQYSVINKTYTKLDCSDQLSCIDTNTTIVFSSTDINQTVDSNQTNFLSYEIIDNNIYKVVIDENTTNYNNILSITSDTIGLCSDSNQTKAFECTEANNYLVIPNSVDDFISTYNN